MQILAFERPVAGAPAPTPETLRREAVAVWRLHLDGAIRAAWFTADSHEAVLMLECTGRGDAASLLDGLPLVSAGHIRFDLFPLRPYDGFARLFGETPGV